MKPAQHTKDWLRRHSGLELGGGSERIPMDSNDTGLRELSRKIKGGESVLFLAVFRWFHRYAPQLSQGDDQRFQQPRRRGRKC